MVQIERETQSTLYYILYQFINGSEEKSINHKVLYIEPVKLAGVK